MNSVLEDIVKTKIAKQKNINFQLFVNKLYSVCYENNFVSVKQKNDKGSDGILNNTIVLACYSPDNYNLNDFKHKIKGDFESYEQNWMQTHKGWQVVFNGDFLANMIQYVQSLYSSAEFIGIDNLLQFINIMNWTKQNQIFEYLGISNDYIVYDIVDEIVQDIIKISTNNDSYVIDTNLTPIMEKIVLNYSEDEVETAIDEMTDYLQYASFVKDYLKDNNEYFSILLNRIKEDFKSLNSSKTFGEKVIKLMQKYVSSPKRNSDDIYKYYTKVLILYMFENCYIG
jgi:hypothetical protein